MDFLLWYEEGPVGLFIRESLWGYPIVLFCHAVGMATVMGVVVVVNMRVLGFAKELSVQAFAKLFNIAWLGFFINLISGLILFAGSTSTYVFQGAFQLKIGAIVLGDFRRQQRKFGRRAQRIELVHRHRLGDFRLALGHVSPRPPSAAPPPHALRR